MPRTGRIQLPDYPHHIVQHGQIRQAVFATEADYRYYLETLHVRKLEYDVRDFACCLMTNRVHLLLQPPCDAYRLGLLMKRLAGRQTRCVNRLRGTSGTLWESRYKSGPFQTGRYLLACCRYIELNPVRTGIVEHPGRYRWSSCPLRLNDRGNNRLDEHPCCGNLVNQQIQRSAAM